MQHLSSFLFHYVQVPVLQEIVLKAHSMIKCADFIFFDIYIRQAGNHLDCPHKSFPSF